MNEAMWEQLQRLFALWTGNRLARYAGSNAMEALARIARRQRMTPEACLRALESGELHSEREALIETLVNRTTWFLRDAKGIYAVVEQMQQRNLTDVNIWVAGCATGQEPYTLTMALLDAGLRPRVLATDISREALRAASAGRYRGHELARVPELWKSRYFVSLGRDEMRVAGRVRDCITFQHGNLAAGPPAWPSRWDAVICRNVLLYFERAHAVSIIQSLNAVTAFLLLSPVEQPLAWIAHASRIEVSQEVVLLRGTAATRSTPSRPPLKPRARTEPMFIVPRAPATDAHGLVGRACQRLAEGALDEAIALCDVAIGGDRLFAAAHLAKGIALKRATKFVEAVPVLRNARFLTHDESWLAPYTLARCLERLADSDGAAEAYRHALSIIEGGGASGLASWDASMDAFAHTVAETCRARLEAIRPVLEPLRR
jgi:chemotaxis protein methyltransferase CheR